MNKKILVDHRDMLNPEIGVDAIVNSSNTQLRLGSNVSKHISDNAGDELQNALNEIAHEQGKDGHVPVGSAFLTASHGVGGDGSIIKYIIHAVTMSWPDPSLPDGRLLATPEQIMQTAQAAVKCADHIGCQSMTFPVMAARPGYSTIMLPPLETRIIAMTSMVLGIKQAFRDTQHLETIYITAWSKDGKHTENDIQVLRNLIAENKISSP